MFSQTNVLSPFKMPTFFVFRNGEKIGDLVGADPRGLQVCTLVLET